MQRATVDCTKPNVLMPVSEGGNFVQVVKALGDLLIKDNNGNQWAAKQNWSGKVKAFGSLQVQSTVSDPNVVLNIGDYVKPDTKEQEFAVLSFENGQGLPIPVPVDVVNQPLDVQGPYPSFGPPIPFGSYNPVVMGISVANGAGGFTPSPWESIDGVSGLVSGYFDEFGFDLGDVSPVTLTWNVPGGKLTDVEWVALVLTGFGSPPAAWTGQIQVNVNPLNQVPVVKNIQGTSIAGGTILAAAGTDIVYYVNTAGFDSIKLTYTPAVPGDPDVNLHIRISIGIRPPFNFF